VATAGTALTEMHLKAMSRFTGDIRLAFDEDQAGQNATERAIPIASKVGVTLSIITIPEGKDPDELIRKDVGAWIKVLDQHQYALDWLIDRYRKQLDLNSAVGKRQFSDILLTVVRGINDSVEQDHYVQVIADIIGVSKDALRSKLNQTERTQPVLKKSKAEPVQPSVDTELMKFQDRLLAIMLMQPALRSYLKDISIDMLATETAQKLWAFLETHPDFSGDPKEAAKLKEIGDYAKILSLQFEELYQGLELLELRNEAARLQVRVIEHYVKKQKQLLAQRMPDATDDEATRLLEQAKDLDQLLKAHKGGL
jgi:DNA primase